jgi:hypothetical protein
METTASFMVNIVGEDTGRSYAGKFVVKTRITRRDNFIADERRRFLLGSNPQAASPAVQGEAFIFGQLAVRIMEAPKFWTDSDNGLDLEDANVIGEIFKLAMDKEEEFQKAIKEKAEEATKALSKKVSKSE